MTTNNALNTPLAGTTGTGNFVGSNSPSVTTMDNVGVTNASNANAGSVGEFVTSNLPFASATSLTSTTAKNVTTISLTAGDWDVIGNVKFVGVSVPNPSCNCWCSLTSATAPNPSLLSDIEIVRAASNFQFGANTALLRVNVTSTTTVYLSVVATFASGSMTACGSIFARRVR